MPTVKPRTMPGVLELLPLEQVAFERMLDTIKVEFERFGFLPVATPTMELKDVLLTKTGGETERQVYLAQSSGARDQGHEPDLALRFDLTVPLARYVAEHEQQLAFPFRRYQIQPVFRGESPQHGRYREFYQCDIDVVGRDQLSIKHDAEIPAVIAAVFERLGFGAFTIRMNNRKVLKGLLDHLGVDDPGRQGAILREVDKLEKRGPEAVGKSVAGLGMDSAAAARLLDIVGSGPIKGDAIGGALDELDIDQPRLTEGVSELRRVFELMKAQGVDDARYALDLSIARGLDYYTGTVYETLFDDHPGLGSICSGGRYDDLASLFTSARLPGVGISIGLTRLFAQLMEIGVIETAASSVMVLVTLLDDVGLADNLGLATALRAAGVNTEAVLETGKLGAQLKYASRSGIRLALICGED
ncbi:MAG TPA: histidine--tRNA ligase, partial [Acidimicrobiia bacterium]|nr:histidine--tRNA ligase [Acidimicrobiia bacterium]